MKTMLRHILMAAGILLVGSACERRPLYDNYGGNVYLDITIDTETSRGYPPVGMNAAAFSPASGTLHQTYLTGPEGGYISIVPDTYHFLIYNYDTEFTLVRNDNDINAIEAYTNEAPGDVRRNFKSLMLALAAARGEESRTYASDPLINQPDHLYVGLVEDEKVPVSLTDDEIHHINVTACTILEKYYLQISHVTGWRYIASFEAFVTGQASAKSLRDCRLTNGPATLHVPLEASPENNWFYTDFLTFGKYPATDDPVFVILRIVDLDGNVFTWEWNVTDQVDSGSHRIIVDADINIPATSSGQSGGLAPEVSDWGDIVTNIVI